MNKVTISEGQGLVDVAVKDYGTVEALFVLASGNGLELDATLLPGQEIEEPEFTAPANKLPVYTKPEVEVVNPVSVSTGQSILDLALQETGSLEGLFQLLAANNLTIGGGLQPGLTLAIPEAAVSSKAVRDYFRAKNIRVNTGVIEAVPSGDLPDGVYIVDADGAYIIDNDGAYLLAE